MRQSVEQFRDLSLEGTYLLPRRFRRVIAGRSQETPELHTWSTSPLKLSSRDGNIAEHVC
jgi:hypothetical protein